MGHAPRPVKRQRRKNRQPFGRHADPRPQFFPDHAEATASPMLDEIDNAAVIRIVTHRAIDVMPVSVALHESVLETDPTGRDAAANLAAARSGLTRGYRNDAPAARCVRHPIGVGIHASSKRHLALLALISVGITAGVFAIRRGAKT